MLRQPGLEASHSKKWMVALLGSKERHSRYVECLTLFEAMKPAVTLVNLTETGINEG
jgi:hypothetical protein